MELICPTCKSNLLPYTQVGQTVDVCPVCAGMWFDPGELGAIAHDLISKGDIGNQVISDAYKVKPQIGVPIEVPKVCPRCSVKTRLFNYAYDSNVFLNKCPACDGVWADGGELVLVAQYLKGHPSVNKFANSLVEAITKRERPSAATKILYSKVLSGGIALLYLAGAVIFGDPKTIFNVAMFILLPLACIWYSKSIGSYTGMMSFPRPAITKKSSGIVLAIAGWVLLLMPIVVSFVVAD